MVSFPFPKFEYKFELANEIEALHNHKARESRFIPPKEDDKLLIASWNIANLGAHRRRDEHYQLIAEIISWYDLVAIQEVANDLTGLRRILHFLPGDNYQLLFNDKGGNDERSAFIFDASKITLLEHIGEVAVAPSSKRHINLPGVEQDFRGFDRNPFFATFQFNDFIFMVANLHIFFGSERRQDIERRALETFALGRWADLSRRSKYAITDNIMAMGDFNLPKVEPGDPIYEALTRRGLSLPDHSTRIFSNIANDKQYDQIAFFPGMKRNIEAHGVYDYDTAIFSELFQGDGSLSTRSQRARFRQYCRYFISDHRPIWMQLSIDAS